MNKSPIRNSGYEISSGFRIRIIQTTAGKRYQVDLGRKSGRHIRKSFKLLKDARSYAQMKRREVTECGENVLYLSDQMRFDMQHALQLLSRHGVSLSTAARHYIEHNSTSKEYKIVGYLIDIYLKNIELKLQKNELRPRSAEETRKHLCKFRADHNKLIAQHIDGARVDKWLDAKNFKPTSRNNYRRYISIFFNWCINNGYVTSNPIKKTRKIRRQFHTPLIYSSDQTKHIMSMVERNYPQLTAYMSLAFFAGIRPQELMRLEWKDIDLSQKEILVTASNSKTGLARIVHISDNLYYWLKNIEKRDGKIFCFSESSLKRWRQRIFKICQIESIQDGARHSYATYHLALHTISETTQEMGHSNTKTLFRHYRGIARNRNQEAKSYFSILPQEYFSTD